MMLWNAVCKDNKSLHEVYHYGHKCLNTFSDDSLLGLNDLKYIFKLKKELHDYCVGGYRNTLHKRSKKKDNFDLRETSDYYVITDCFGRCEADEL